MRPDFLVFLSIYKGFETGTKLDYFAVRSANACQKVNQDLRTTYAGFGGSNPPITTNSTHPSLYQSTQVLLDPLTNLVSCCFLSQLQKMLKKKIHFNQSFESEF